MFLGAVWCIKHPQPTTAAPVTWESHSYRNKEQTRDQRHSQRSRHLPWRVTMTTSTRRADRARPTARERMVSSCCRTRPTKTGPLHHTAVTATCTRVNCDAWIVQFFLLKQISDYYYYTYTYGIAVANFLLQFFHIIISWDWVFFFLYTYGYIYTLTKVAVYCVY